MTEISPKAIVQGFNSFQDREYGSVESPLGASETDPILKSMTDAASDDIDFFLSIVSRCDSPIEKIFLESLLAVGFHRYGTLKVISLPLTPELPSDHFSTRMTLRRPGGLPRCELRIEKQAQLGCHRVDFLLTDGDRKIIVECDGHDFHERTKEQAAKDKRRDRELQALGHMVLRFTGSEIWRDPIRCAEEALNFYQGEVNAGS